MNYKKGRLLTVKDLLKMGKQKVVLTINNIDEIHMVKLVYYPFINYILVDENGFSYYSGNFSIYEYIDEKQYQGWEILKMINEGKLEEGTTLIDDWNATEYTIKKKYDHLILAFKSTNGLDVIVDSLLLRTFTIKEKEYLTFDEARKSQKRFKHRHMNDYSYNIWMVLKQLSFYCPSDINKMLDEKAWEIEEEKR